MKYVCFGYHDPESWNALSDADRDEATRQTLAYQDLLRKNGHFIDARALQDARSATTLKFDGGTMSVVDGPFIETKEFLGGFMVLEANDLNHAIQLLAQLPCMRTRGSIEIRPVNEDLETNLRTT
jgi:hypothetical protein